MKQQNYEPNGNTRPIIIKEGDKYIQCNTIEEAKAATELAKELSKCGPTTINVCGLFTVKASSLYNAAGGAAVVVGSIYIYFKWVKPLCKNNAEGKEIPTTVPSPTLLSGAGNKAEALTLNDIGKSSVSMPVQLLGNYVYEGDIAWFFSVTNTGKTILAMEAAIALASGSTPSFLPEGTPSVKRSVLYYNFQMRPDQLKKRYFNNTENVSFPDNLEIIFCNETIKTISDLENDIAKRLEGVTESVVIFVDTAKDILPICTTNDSKKLNTALRTIQKDFKDMRGLSVTYILIGQTNKKYIQTPLALPDLSGSFNMATLADSIFAMGQTCYGKYTRLLKLLKGRVEELPEQVALLEMREAPYLRPVYVKDVAEEDVLPKPKTNKKKTPHEQLPPTTPPQAADGNSSIDKVPHDVAMEMWKWYQKGVDGHGLKAVCDKFGEPYGLKYPIDISRLFEKHGFNVKNKKNEGQR